MKRLLKRYTLGISLAAIPLSVAIACNFLTRSAGEIPVTGEPANSTVTEEPIAGGTEEATLSGRFAAGLALIVGGSMRLMGRHRWVSCVATMIGTAVCIHYLFGQWLTIPLPKGMVGW